MQVLMRVVWRKKVEAKVERRVKSEEESVKAGVRDESGNALAASSERT